MEKHEHPDTAGYYTSINVTQPINDMGWALKQLRNGSLVRRRGWNGKGMHLALQFSDPKMTQAYIYMRTAQGHLVPWTCSQTDLLSQDWEFAEV